MFQPKVICLLFVVFLLVGHLRPAAAFSAASDEHKTLAIGASAPDFHLPGIDGNTYSLASFKKARILVLVFTADLISPSPGA